MSVVKKSLQITYSNSYGDTLLKLSLEYFLGSVKSDWTVKLIISDNDSKKKIMPSY